MCGIAGFVGKGDETILAKMAEAINHRGPDNQSFSLIQNVGFAHTRLSIIDIDSRSNQPLCSFDQRYSIVFNGEIYNYQALKNDLQKTGRYSFNTQSDTEVLLYTFIEYGKDCLAKLEGMFAFAIYDFHKEELWLARDRMGQKPLYYTIQGGNFIFASELKSILQHPSSQKEINFQALNEYLTFDYVPTPSSIFKDIHKLEASHYLVFKHSEIREKTTYWQPDFTLNPIQFHDAKHRLEQLLNQAVNRRLISDVPLGVFLSGGLDSSTIAYFAQKNSSKKIKTFAIGFEEKSYAEQDYARLVADFLGTEHYEAILTEKKALNLFPKVFDKLDEPFADPSILPTYFLSQFAQQEVTVALGGDGSDELLAGYPTFQAERFAVLFRKLLPISSWSLNVLQKMLPRNDGNISLDFKIEQFLKGFQSSKKHTHSLWLSSFTPRQKNKLFSSEISPQLILNQEFTQIDYYFNQASNASYFSQLLYSYYRSYLQDDILVKVDRASMFNSLEVRAPFLDSELIQFISSLPKSYKIRGNHVKRILKQTMMPYLPKKIITRPKKGFGIPLSIWLRNELKDLRNKLLSTQRIEQQGIFNSLYINQLLQEHDSKKQNHRKLIWNLLVFQMWYENYM